MLEKFESQIVGRANGGGGAEHGGSFVVCRELDCGEGAAQVRVASLSVCMFVNSDEMRCVQKTGVAVLCVFARYGG